MDFPWHRILPFKPSLAYLKYASLLFHGNLRHQGTPSLSPPGAASCCSRCQLRIDPIPLWVESGHFS